MTNKESSLSRLIRGIRYHANIRIEDIADSIGYERTYISRLFKSGKDNAIIYGVLKEKYPLITQLVANELTGKANSYSLLSDDPTISEVKSALQNVIAALDRIEKSANSNENGLISESGQGLKKPSGK